MSPKFAVLLSILVLASTVNAYPAGSGDAHSHGHGHEHSPALANGQSCYESVSTTWNDCISTKVRSSPFIVDTHGSPKQVQCQSQYCHHGTCDVKKPNGHVCYKVSVDQTAKVGMDSAQC